MNRRFVGTVSLLAVSAVLVWVAGCTRPISTGPIPKPQSAQSITASPTPSEAIPTTVLGTVVAGATATSAATGPEPTLPPVEPTSTPIPAAPAPAATAAPSGSGTSHTVKSGEWLFSIARQYGVSPYTLAQVNGIGAPYTIRPGQVLVIPSGGTAPVPGTGGTYTVQRGDTIYSIARKLGKTPSAIINANNLANANFIFPGQVLRIP
jgi:peptidoglycan-N-acetylglucosamine deacetylase